MLILIVYKVFSLIEILVITYYTLIHLVLDLPSYLFTRNFKTVVSEKEAYSGLIGQQVPAGT